MAHDETKPASRLRLLAPFGILAGLAIIHAAYWIIVSAGIKTEAENWISDKEIAGYTIAHQGLGIGGYPFRFTVHIHQPDITAPRTDGGWRLRQERMAASAQFYNLNHWIVTLDQTAELETVTGAEPARYLINTEQARFSLQTRSGATHRVGAEVTGLTVQALNGPSPLITAIERFVAQGRTSGSDNTLLAQIQTEGAVFNAALLGADMQTAFGETAQLFQLEASLTDFTTLAMAGDALAWTRAGGRVIVDQAYLDWGPATLSGEGDVTLDDLMRPTGRLSIVVTDPESLISAMEAGGLLHDEQGAALRLATMMAPRRDAGIALPFRLQEGGVFLGPARIGTVAPLD